MRNTLSLLLGWLVLCSALLEEQLVSFDFSSDSVPLHNASILYSSDDPVGVQNAANSLAGDFEQITGNRPSVISLDPVNVTGCAGCKDYAIIAATVNSALLKHLVLEGKVDVSGIEGKWETFQTSVVEDPLNGVKRALVIAGSDKRAAVFGLYTLSEQCGQSPFHWWADVPAQEHSEIYALAKSTTHGEPSVKYRGLMINDEAPGLTGWWSKVHGVDHQPLDSEFYMHVFDMLLRLKGNFMWPAMWESSVPRPGNIFFTDDPKNMQLADDYGIVMSTSHHEPMQRATNEWNETETGPWDWTKNKANVTAFMEEGVHRAAKNESYFTLGMRGAGDGPIQGDDPVGILKDVFQTQRQIFSDYYGNASAANQVWTIYKEVATYYAAGLLPPEDVTLMFTDDNWGNIQRLPLANESERSGGIGMYYHLEYLGTPKEYKWQNTNNLPKVYKELYQAYERGADRIWVINVGDIKPLEVPFSFTMQLAWNMSSIDFDNIPAYLEAFATRDFDSKHAGEIGSIMMENSRLVGRRKHESTQSDTYSVLHYHENERVIAEWKTLADRVMAVLDTLPEDRQPAYWHHVQYPIVAGYVYHATMLGLGKNQQIGFERRNSANDLASQVLATFDQDFDLLEQYDSMLDGKWAGMLAQPHYDQYVQSYNNDWKEPTKDAITGLWYVQLRQNATYAFGNLGIYAENCESAQLQGRSLPSADASAPTDGDFAPTLPIMDPYGKGIWQIDLFHRGDYRVPIEWEVDIPFDWITVSPSSGIVSMEQLEQRLNISVDWSAVPANMDEEIDMRINFNTPPWFDLIRLPIMNYRVPDDFTGFPETSGLISIESPHCQRKSTGNVTFEHIPQLGTRTNSGSLALRPYSEARVSAEVAQDAWVDYDIYLFNESSSLTATVYVNGALDTDPTLPMSYSLTLDGDDTNTNWTRLLGDPDTPGATPPGWQTSVADHVWMRNVTLGNVTEGSHTLRWRTNSPEVYLEKIVLDTRQGLKSSYLGPPETTLIS
ncbi:Uu.00g006270.m01.CDS01 [Anthostomella pinea]|uniref:Uu.00g006270.m01.CDS01 n=1 Tax=Anthostomella pinea TaxID=933095 RepID=A0AAI8YJ03_9PEZI|nr:Uu.00g006270.m01.CDS01 [Anthostomella pinea]